MKRSVILPLILLCSFAGTSRADMLVITGPTDLTPGSSSTYIFQFVATSPITIESFDLVLGYDHLKVALSNIRLTSDTQSDFASTSNSSLTDRLIFSASANSLGHAVGANSSTNLMALDVLILEGATGTTDLNLMLNVSSTFTSINESLPLNPAPTNGFDPGIDARINLGSIGVPEPGACELFLSGLLGSLVWMRRRGKTSLVSCPETFE